jgi:hypothetical protein
VHRAERRLPSRAFMALFLFRFALIRANIGKPKTRP